MVSPGGCGGQNDAQCHLVVVFIRQYRYCPWEMISNTCIDVVVHVYVFLNMHDVEKHYAKKYTVRVKEKSRGYYLQCRLRHDEM